ncbi:MAG: hypothetical protein A2052_08610 [Deltaproteobacteria bacterium GWA2_54_12]|nr:MAG: hypothetical protein A2052_08610 [Deltaproteobacteria bacterium GWA2_54_12]
MPFDDLAKNELISILELIDQAQRCSGASGLQSLILNAALLLEAEFTVCGLARTGTDGLPVVTSYVNGNYPEEWVRRYIESAYHRKDPVVRFHTKYALTQTWTNVFRQFEDKAARQVVNEASDYGLRFGITGALYVPEMDNIAMFTFAGRADKFGSHHKRIADILSLHFTRALAGCARESLFATGHRLDDEGHPKEREGKAW